MESLRTRSARSTKPCLMSQCEIIESIRPGVSIGDPVSEGGGDVDRRNA